MSYVSSVPSRWMIARLILYFKVNRDTVTMFVLGNRATGFHTQYVRKVRTYPTCRSMVAGNARRRNDRGASRDEPSENKATLRGEFSSNTEVKRLNPYLYARSYFINVKSAARILLVTEVQDK